jgi:hypothetical protein
VRRGTLPRDGAVYPSLGAGTSLAETTKSARRQPMYIGIGTLVLIILLILLLT